jgi:hypothetical protein
MCYKGGAYFHTKPNSTIFERSYDNGMAFGKSVHPAANTEIEERREERKEKKLLELRFVPARPSVSANQVP